jgi:hypothetical protein
MNKQEIYKWLDKNIEAYERTVIILQNKVDNYDKVLQGPLDPFEQQPKEFYIESLDNYKNMLNIFKQIKTELEAWEAVKELLIKGESISLSALFRYHLEVYNKINKALEVKDE